MFALNEFISRPSVTLILLFLVLSVIIMIGAWFITFFYSEIKQQKAESFDASNLSWLEEVVLHSGLLAKVLMIVNIILLSGLVIYYYIDGTSMQGHVMEWLNLLLRWVHVIFGILWTCIKKTGEQHETCVKYRILFLPSN